jgi:hypothetical protein
MNAVFKICTAVLLIHVPVSGTSLENFLFTAERDGKESGSGFLLKDTHGVWMVSNCHVVRQNGEITFTEMTDASRVFTLPDAVEVAANRDAVRFKTGEIDGLKLTETCSFDDKVFAFGNSDGLGVITKSAGKVVGKGRGEIEVTCEIIPGNSGGPVINARDEVIGVATFGVTTYSAKITAELSGTVSAAEREHLIEKIKDRYGTRYTETRRFAVPLHDAEWQPVDLELFRQESKQYEQIDDRFGRFNEAVETVFRCRTIRSENENLFPRGWVRNYNQDLNDYGDYDADSGRYYLRSGRKESFDRAYGRWIRTLSEAAEALSDEFREQSAALTILYYQNEVRAYADKLNSKRSDLMDIAGKYGR